MNNAFHEGMIASNQHSPGYRGIYWRLSNAHVILDVCTDMAADMSHGTPGFYPKGKEPVRPHPQCMCVAIPVYEDPGQYTERLHEWRDNPQLHPDIEAWYNTGTTRQVLGSVSGKSTMIDTIMDSKAILKFDETHRALIKKDLEKASDVHLRIVEKTIGHADVIINSEGYNFYREGTGRITLNMSQNARNNVQIFWHEFGHYLDDGVFYPKNGLKLKTLKAFDRRDIDELGISRRAHYLHNYDVEVAIPDLQRFLDQMVPGKYEVRGPDDARIFLKGTKTRVGNYWGTSTTPGEGRRNFETLVEEVNVKLKSLLGADDAEKYLVSLGKPLAPIKSDFLAEYRTPKRKDLKSKEVFKGAEKAYKEVQLAHAEALATWEVEHAAALLHAKALEDAFMERHIRFLGVLDTIEGQARGEMGTYVLWGGHTSKYHKTFLSNTSEGWANWFQLTFQNDVEMLTYFKQYAPEADRIFRESFDEMIRQTFGE
ncbi:MAG: hypothetical protein DDT33_01328 [Firmicutes bacterium]|nr:hypothetical protein [Bacillota bacterium]